MTETLANSEHIEEPKTPLERIEIFFLDIQRQAAELTKKRYANIFDANDDADDFVRDATEKAEDVLGVSVNQVRISGTGVRVPEFDIRGVEDSETGNHGLAVIIDQKNSLRSLDSFESITGRYRGLLANVVEEKTEEPAKEDEKVYKILIDSIFDMDDTVTNPVNIQNTNIAIMDIIMRRRALASYTGEVYVVPVDLEKIRQSHDLAEKISQEGLVNTLFMKNLRNLNRAFFNEDDSQYVSLNKIAIVKRIGSLGEKYARNGYEQASIVSSAIKDTFGANRHIKLTYTEIFEDIIETEGSVAGTVSMVIMPESQDDETIPSLVINYGSGQKEIEFEKIKTLDF